MKKIRLSQLIAYNNPSQAMRLVYSYGVKPQTDQNSLALQLDKLIVMYKEDVLRQLAEIHPHWDLISSRIEEIQNEKKSSLDAINNGMVQPSVQQQQQPVPNNNLDADMLIKFGLVAGMGLLIGISIVRARL